MNAAYSQLLLQVVRDRCASRTLVRVSGLFLLVAVAALVFARYVERPDMGWSVSAGAAAFLILAWGGALLKSAVQQNQPAYACLVPQLRRRLIVLTLALQTAVGLLVATLAAAVFGHFGYALAGAGFFFCFMLYAQRYALVALLPSILILASVSVLKAPLHALWESIRWLGEPALTGIGLIAAALSCGFALRAAFPRGGDKHWSWHARHAVWLRGGTLKQGGASRWNRWSMCLRPGYRAALRRDTRGGAAQGDMLLHSLGPSAHAGSSYAYVLLIALAVAVVWSTSGDVESLRLMMRNLLMQACVLYAVVLYATELQKGAARHGAEQALYLLTPGAPAAAQLNRVLGAALLKRFMRVWLAAAVCAALFDMLMLGGLRLYASTCLLSALLLPLSCTLLRNYATMQASSNQTALLVTTFLATMTYLIVLGIERTVPAFPLFSAAAAIALASLLALGWRWRRLMALPAVLPAGRLLG